MSFKPFSRLPIEIRHKIWDEVCCVPRGVDIVAHTLAGEDGVTNVGDSLGEAFDKPAIVFASKFYCYPSILCVSHEARSIGLKHYTLDFGTKLQIDEKVNGNDIHIRITVDPKIYINWSCDIVCLSQNIAAHPGYNIDEAVIHAMMDYFVTKPLRRIAVASHMVRQRSGREKLCNMLSHHNSVEIIVYEDENEYKRFSFSPTPGGSERWAELAGSRSAFWPCLQLTDDVRLYDTRIKYGRDGLHFSHLNTTIDLLEDGFKNARHDQPELERLSLPKIRPMALIAVPGCIPRMPRREICNCS